MFSVLLALIYVCFVSLGLPDSLLGSAWPSMYPKLSVSFSAAGLLSMLICFCTILSSLASDFLTSKLGTGKVTAVSVAMTAIALFGFSVSNRFCLLIVWAIPYGLGAGSVDAALNNYVSLHYKSRHMSWLHCMWGVGAAISPYIMSFALIRLSDWHKGYLIVSIIQMALSVIVFCSLPLWKKSDAHSETPRQALPLKQVFKIKGAVPCFITFFCYCALENTTMVWASSYMVLHNGLSAEKAAGLASTFFIGITVGRAINGFLTMKWNDRTLIRLGEGFLLGGIVLIALPFHYIFSLIGFIVIGFGCAPVYPCIIHMTPELFGRDKSQAMIGMQMASAYTGSCFIPPLFGVLANAISPSILPVFLSVFLFGMIFLHEVVVKKTKTI